MKLCRRLLEGYLKMKCSSVLGDEFIALGQDKTCPKAIRGVARPVNTVVRRTKTIARETINDPTTKRSAVERWDAGIGMDEWLWAAAADRARRRRHSPHLGNDARAFGPLPHGNDHGSARDFRRSVIAAGDDS